VKVEVCRSVTAPQVIALGEHLVPHAGLGSLVDVADMSNLTGSLSRG
jgi:hypothetical protein